MGGNVVIGDEKAGRINLRNNKRSDVVFELKKSFDLINFVFKELYGENLIGFFSGSSQHLFDIEGIDDEMFKKYKPSVGDIDVQVNRQSEKKIYNFLERFEGRQFRDLTLIGVKRSALQAITLWYSEILGHNVQIDFEFSEYHDSTPTAWSQFSHSSSWDDIMMGVKGVAHKYLLRAITTVDKEKAIIRMKTKDKEEFVKSFGFSVDRGLRRKFQPVFDELGRHINLNGLRVYKELKTKDSKYVTDIPEIYELLFSKTPTASDINKMNSFTGLLDIVNKNFNNSEKMVVAKEFVELIWGTNRKRGQQLYRDDMERDLAEKSVMMDVMSEKLGIPKHLFDVEKNKYYSTWKT